MKIYTKTGDAGTTSLIGGLRVPKYHERIEAYGTVDELISHTGLLRDTVQMFELEKMLLFIQDRLMVCATVLATGTEVTERQLPVIHETDIEKLEFEIDAMESTLPPLTSFVLPGGNAISSQAQICRTICRRAERRALALSVSAPTDPFVIRFLNRLSDYYFVLARYIVKEKGGIESPWIP
jgi:cob(I)alamin adenosyltransferase